MRFSIPSRLSRLFCPLLLSPSLLFSLTCGHPDAAISTNIHLHLHIHTTRVGTLNNLFTCGDPDAVIPIERSSCTGVDGPPKPDITILSLNNEIGSMDAFT